MNLIIPKICSCGRVFTAVPTPFKEGLESRDEYVGYYWDCECKSTLFAPLATVECAHDLCEKTLTCTACGKDFREDVLVLSQDRAKDFRKYGN